MSENQAPPPLPVIDPTSQFFWDGAARGELMIQRCRSCGSYQHPPRPVCTACLSTELAPERMSGRAILYTWTVAEQVFHPWFADKIPYAYATVELEEQAGLRVITNIVDTDPYTLEAGMALQVAFRELSPEVTVPIFRPA